MLSPRRSAQLGLASAVALFAGCLAVLAHGSLADRRALSTRPGVVAPDFRLPDAADPANRSLQLSDLRGSTVVVAFGQPDGSVEDDQDRRMAELAARYAGGGDRVRFLAVRAGGMGSAGRSRVERLLDADGAVAKRYAASAAPMVLVIDPAGVIRYRGPLPGAGERPASLAGAGATVG